MKTVLSMIAALGIAVVLSAPANAGINDPETIIYRFPGVRDDGSGQFAGFATVFNCTNFSGVTENIRFATRREDGFLAGNQLISIAHLTTLSAATHTTRAYTVFDIGLTQGASTGALNAGTTAIAATSTNIICTAAIIDASATRPDGLPLRGIRFSPVPGSQE